MVLWCRLDYIRSPGLDQIELTDDELFRAGIIWRAIPKPHHAERASRQVAALYMLCKFVCNSCLGSLMISWVQTLEALHGKKEKDTMVLLLRSGGDGMVSAPI